MNHDRPSREDIVREFPLLDYCMENLGMRFEKKIGGEYVDCCPFHQDKTPSFRVNAQKQVWTCDPCGNIGGSVIDLHSRVHSMSIKEALRDLSEKMAPGQFKPETKKAAEAPPTDKERKLVKTYDYTDESGNVLYQVCRYEPKDFRQRRPDGNGGWIWKLEGVTRVLFRLPAVLMAGTVVIVEGEKDACNLAELGYEATCNVGGAGKWCDAYSDCLKGKDVIVIPDGDKPGRTHGDDIVASLNEKANSVKLVVLPDGFKDASDLILSLPGKDAAKAKLEDLFAKTPHALAPLPLFSVSELEQRYRHFVNQAEFQSFNLSNFLPSLAQHVRKLVPGELVVLMADTGVGKTALAQSLARAARPLPTLFFELELPEELMFERFVQMETNQTGDQVEDVYRAYTTPRWQDYQGLQHILVCPESGISTEKIESYIYRSELKFGARPVVVIVDYIGLVKGNGTSRYERVSEAAEQLKVIAKRTRTIILIGTQVSRPEKSRRNGDNQAPLEIRLHDAKDSGSVENTAGLVIGAWRPKDDTLILKILKNTKGKSGHQIECNFDGPRMRITERSHDAQEFAHPYD